MESEDGMIGKEAEEVSVSSSDATYSSEEDKNDEDSEEDTFIKKFIKKRAYITKFSRRDNIPSMDPHLNLPQSNNKTLIFIFRSFFYEGIIDEIVKNSNSYAEMQSKGNPKQMTRIKDMIPVIRREFEKWLGDSYYDRPNNSSKTNRLLVNCASLSK